MHKRLIVLLLSCLVLGTFFAQAAQASCAGSEGTLKQRLADSDIVFVGTVTKTASDGRLATVKVESVWRGEVTPVATVAGGELAPGTMTSVDRTFAEDTRYLFTPDAFQGGHYADNACTDTQEWTPKIEKLRPEGATPVHSGATPAEASSDDAPVETASATSQPGSPVRLVALVVGAALLLVGAVVLGRRLRP